MRDFRRPKVELERLSSACGTERARQLASFAADGKRPVSFPEHWTQPAVRGALWAMHGQVCAFCGASIGETGSDVEHFRPKGAVSGEPAHGGYWWLAYDFNNYFLSCIQCNQRIKRSQFPLRSGAARVRFDNRNELAAEQRLFLDPSCDDIDGFITFDWRAGELKPKAGLPPSEFDRVMKVIEFFDLNGWERARARREIYREVVVAVEANRLDDARERAIRYRPHSLVARSTLLDKAPHTLPTPEEELEWLLADFCEGLKRAKAQIGQVTTKEALKRAVTKQAILTWALAVLWKDPPAATPQFVEQFLDKRQLKDSLESVFQKL